MRPVAVGDPSTAVYLARLSSIEAGELEEYEAIIERGLRTFREVGDALLHIRDRRLYRAHHSTFEAYCRKRWGMSRPRAYQMIEAAGVVGQLSTNVDILPANEAQARPLTRLLPEQQAPAWQRAVETAPNGKVTAAHVQRIVEEEFAPRPAPVVAPKMAVHYSSETPEWHTPANIIARVVRVLGKIDLDPCSNDPDSPSVPAIHHLTVADDGLAHPWFGRIYMNPPYGREIVQWVEHLCGQYEAGHTIEAIALVPARTDSRWFRRLRDYPRCFIWGRLKFSGMDNSAPFPSMAVYLGHNLKEFVGVFNDIGDIYALV